MMKIAVLRYFSIGGSGLMFGWGRIRGPLGGCFDLCTTRSSAAAGIQGANLLPCSVPTRQNISAALELLERSCPPQIASGETRWVGTIELVAQD